MTVFKYLYDIQNLKKRFSKGAYSLIREAQMDKTVERDILNSK